MQTQFICYKPKVVNLKLRYKLIRILIKLLVKKYKTKIKPINPTQPEVEHFKFYWVEGNPKFYFVGIFTSQTY